MFWKGLPSVQEVSLFSVLAEAARQAFHAGNYKDLTENGNRARRVSGSQGRKGLY